jgi:hypothetical protein
MFDSQKHVFWQALILAIFIFGIGMLLGYLLELSREGEIQKLYSQTEIDLLDVKVQSDILTSLPINNCDLAVQENLKFADRIYDESKLLDRYENANKISQTIILEHKKYDLMRTMLWANSIKIKNDCNASYHNLIYLYDYNDPRMDTRAVQSVFSRILSQIKEERGSDILLIPLAGDNNVSSLRLLMSNYGVSEGELPVVLIDENVKITELESKDEIEKYLN